MASRCAATHGWPLRLVGAGALLLEERQVAARGSSSSRNDRPGFWERNGYHNADPWREGASLTGDALAPASVREGLLVSPPIIRARHAVALGDGR